MILYPKLPLSPTVTRLAQRLGSLAVEACRLNRADTHPEAVYSATGGTKASVDDLANLAKRLTETAERHGYPTETRREHTQADREWAVDLHEGMRITPHEAADEAIWHFLTCVVVPDLVRWRWGKTTEGQVSDRWLNVRRTGRNCFGRLWWRAELLRTAGGAYELLQDLGEDEQVQLMERPHLVGHRALTLETISALREHPKAKRASNRSDLFRDVQKRLLRMGAFIEFQSLPSAAIATLVSQAFDAAADAKGVSG